MILSIILTLQNMVWVLFGLANTSDVNLMDSFKNAELTQGYGTVLYMFYHITSMIILLNMLIASMTQSYERILVLL